MLIRGIFCWTVKMIISLVLNLLILPGKVFLGFGNHRCLSLSPPCGRINAGDKWKSFVSHICYKPLLKPNPVFHDEPWAKTKWT